MNSSPANTKRQYDYQSDKGYDIIVVISVRRSLFIRTYIKQRAKIDAICILSVTKKKKK